MASSLPILLVVATFYIAVLSPVSGVSSPAVGLPPKVANDILVEQKVIVQNRAGDKRDVWVHCFSGDDDLGTHLLRYWQVFLIKFHASGWFNTEFFCTVTWNNVQPKDSQTQHTIVVFKQAFFDEMKCGMKFNGQFPDPKIPFGCTYNIGMNSFTGPDGVNPWNHLSKRLIR